MNTSAKKIYSLALTMVGIFALLCTGVYTAALLSEYSSLSGHFEGDTISSIFLPLLYMLAFVAFALLGIIFRDTLSGRKPKVTLPQLFASAFAALSVIVWLVTFMLDFFSQKAPPIATVFGILLIALAIVTVLYFVSSAFPFTTHKQSVLLGMGTAAFMLVYAFFAYFDTALALNSPIKLLDQVTAIVLLFFFLAEIRFRFGSVSEALFLPICMFASTLALAGSIGALIYNIVEGRPLVVNVMHDFLLFGIAVYAFVRLLSFLLPAIGAEDEASSPIMPAFETEEAATPHEGDSLAQETFDFDNVSEDSNEERPAPFTEDNTAADAATAAALDLEKSEKQ